MYIFPTLYPVQLSGTCGLFLSRKKKLSHDYVKDGGRMTNNPKYIHSVTMEGQILSFVLYSFPPNTNHHHHHLLCLLFRLYPQTKKKTNKTKNFCHIISMFVCNKSKGKSTISYVKIKISVIFSSYIYVWYTLSLT